ncbi:hypothetical protein [Microcystis sp. M42BS1]|uniref:hypothetical protein n=1 Tax=Microcystis sp. M42BS1 TaxID=2771192 RepID=UPI0025886F48|nr:hypothetical protein [Microcystis sp. M42BS1]
MTIGDEMYLMRAGVDLADAIDGVGAKHFWEMFKVHFPIPAQELENHIKNVKQQQKAALLNVYPSGCKRTGVEDDCSSF